MIEPPGWTRLHSLLLLSPRGARLLAACLGLEHRPFLRLSQDARDHCFNIGHDLGANAFFVALAVASRSLPDEGLYHWVGEARCRRLLREEVGSRYAMAPDGWGRYLVAGREVIFFLEWDRGTESLDRLLRKVANYVRYFIRRRGASATHILFVFPAPSKELAFHRDAAGKLPTDERCCVFWTTTVNFLEALSPRGPIWWKLTRRASGQNLGGGVDRIALLQMASQPPSGCSVKSCIAKPGWWERRLNGGQV